MRFVELLTPAEVQRTHEASLEVLETVGILAHNVAARAVFKEHGCRVDDESGLVRFPAHVVEEYRKMAPASFTFRGRDPRFDRTIPDDGPVVVTGSSAPNVCDPVSGVERRATSADIANIAYLINELPGFDVFSISTLAADAPDGQFSLSRFYPALKNCLKPVRSNTPNMDDLRQVIELGELIAGGAEAYRERPVINHHYCPMVSPLTMDVDSTEAVTWLTERGLPVYTTVVPNAGLTAPMTLMGCLVVGNAEFLAITAFQQMIKAGTPVIYASLPTVADMRTGAYTPGAIETGMLIAGQAQLAHFYDVPTGGYIGLTNAHSNDAQSGFETGMNTVLGVSAGATLLNMGGLFSSLMAFDFGKAVVDDEIALMNKRVLRGMEFSEDNLALDVIAEVGPGGDYMKSKHTKSLMKTTAAVPEGRRPRHARAVGGGRPAGHPEPRAGRGPPHPGAAQCGRLGRRSGRGASAPVPRPRRRRREPAGAGAGQTGRIEQRQTAARRPGNPRDERGIKMAGDEVFGKLKQSIVDQDQDAVLAVVDEALAGGVAAQAIIDKGLLPGLNVIGEQFEGEEIFLPELMQAALAFQAAMGVLEPMIKESGQEGPKKGKIVLGTVKGDLHSIGKNILRLLFETSGFEVWDLGIDVDLFKFLDKAKEVDADIIAMSALLTTTLVGQRDVIEALKDQGTRDKYKVIIGGGATTREWADSIGADGWAATAYEAVTLATELV